MLAVVEPLHFRGLMYRRQFRSSFIFMFRLTCCFVIVYGVKSLQVPTLVCHSSVPGGACLLIFIFSCGMAAVLDGSYPRRHFEQLIAGRFDRARSFRNVFIG